MKIEVFQRNNLTVKHYVMLNLPRSVGSGGAGGLVSPPIISRDYFVNLRLFS